MTVGHTVHSNLNEVKTTAAKETMCCITAQPPQDIEKAMGFNNNHVSQILVCLPLLVNFGLNVILQCLITDEVSSVDKTVATMTFIHKQFL